MHNSEKSSGLVMELSANILALEADLRTMVGDRVRRHEPMAHHTLLRVGGPADLWLVVTTLEELVAAVQLARQHHCPVLLVGSGANLLVSDKGVRGLVIQNRCEGTTFITHGKPRAIALSGTRLASLARLAAHHGLSGLEWAIGVPGTLGGALVNNAGAFGGSIADRLVRAELLTPTGERTWQSTEWFEYGYRSSRLKDATVGSSDSFIVLQAELRFERASPLEIEGHMARFSEQRKRTQPSGASLGSMFKNPPGDHAGRLIEAAGLKGRQIGGARISEQHANFFLNTGQACAADFVALIELAQEIVRAKFGIEMELEIQRAGEWR